ncbi:MAG: site-specific integrase [Clostridia bacterium]|jgi:integrase|nr:site-specific integrase [Clostridia bacterium]
MNKRRIVSQTRRNNGEGSIYQRSDGRWAGTVSLGYSDDGKPKRKSIYGKTRAEVSEKLIALTNRIASDNFDYVNNSSLGPIMKEWLLIFKQNSVSPRSFEGNFRNFQIHIEPRIGNMKLDEITNITVQKILNELLAKNYSLATVKKIKFLLNQFFEYAIENNFATSNPVNKTKVRSNERKIYDSENKYKAIPLEIRNKFLTALNEHDFLKAFCMCMMFAGLRTGEVLALTWGNVDFNNKTLKVERGVTIIPKFDENGKILKRLTVVGDTKTACSVREVPMPDILVDALKYHEKTQYFKGKNNNIDLLKPNAFVFANDNGSVRTYSGSKKIFENFLKKYDLKKYGIHFHGLRHTYSNILFEANENPKVIQALLGHKSVKTTITTYNSVDKSYFKQATNIFNEQYTTKSVLTPEPKKENVLENLKANELEELIKYLQQKKLKQEQEQEQENENDNIAYEQEQKKRKKQEAEM